MNTIFASITPTELSHRLNSDPDITLLDVRSPAEYRAGHIPGARLAPLENLGKLVPAKLQADAEAQSGRPVYLTCHAGDRAVRAAQQLHRNGLGHVVLVDGGTRAWQDAGLPVRRCGSALSLERQVQIAVGSLLVLKVVFGFAVHELFFIAGALIGAGLITAGITRWCGMARLIARMPWNRGGDCDKPAYA